MFFLVLMCYRNLFVFALAMTVIMLHPLCDIDLMHALRSEFLQLVDHLLIAVYMPRIISVIRNNLS